MSPLVYLMEFINLIQNQRAKPNTQRLKPSIKCLPPNLHYPQNQGYPIYLIAKIYFKKHYALTRKALQNYGCKITILPAIMAGVSDGMINGRNYNPTANSSNSVDKGKTFQLISFAK